MSKERDWETGDAESGYDAFGAQAGALGIMTGIDSYSLTSAGFDSTDVQKIKMGCAMPIGLHYFLLLITNIQIVYTYI